VNFFWRSENKDFPIQIDVKRNEQVKKTLSLADFHIYNEMTTNKIQISRGVIKMLNAFVIIFKNVKKKFQSTKITSNL